MSWMLGWRPSRPAQLGEEEEAGVFDHPARLGALQGQEKQLSSNRGENSLQLLPGQQNDGFLL